MALQRQFFATPSFLPLLSCGENKCSLTLTPFFEGPLPLMAMLHHCVWLVCALAFAPLFIRMACTPQPAGTLIGTAYK